MKSNSDKGISVYKGEFLIHPIPIEISGNTCSHCCYYCYATLNKPIRKINYVSLIKYLSNYKNKKDIVSELLKLDYPVLLSNRTDPFAKSNIKYSESLLEVLQRNKIQVSIQTKGGEGAIDIIKQCIKEKSIFYVSITFNNDEKCKEIEPNAPNITERIEFIKQLNKLGHIVIVGINPVCEEWLNKTEYKKLLKRIKPYSSRIWLEALHFNYKQINKINPKSNITKEVIEAGRLKKYKSTVIEYSEIAEKQGFDTYYFPKNDSKLFDVYKEVYRKTFPIHTDFVRECEKYKPDIIYKESYVNYFSNRLPKIEVMPLAYLLDVHRRQESKIKLKPKANYRYILEYLWNKDTNMSISNLLCFSHPIINDSELLSDKGEKMLIYNKEGYEKLYTQIKE